MYMWAEEVVTSTFTRKQLFFKSTCNISLDKNSSGFDSHVGQQPFFWKLNWTERNLIHLKFIKDETFGTSLSDGWCYWSFQFEKINDGVLVYLPLVLNMTLDTLHGDHVLPMWCYFKWLLPQRARQVMPGHVSAREDHFNKVMGQSNP